MEVSPSLLVAALIMSDYLTVLTSWDLHVTSSCHRIKIYSVNRSKEATAKRLKYLEEHGESILQLTKPAELPLEDMNDFMKITRTYPREPIS